MSLPELEIGFLGVGSAFSQQVGRGQCNLWCRWKGMPGLHFLDVGTQWANSVHLSLGMLLKEVSELEGLSFYVSHCHADHTGGFEAPAFYTKFNPHAAKPSIIGNPTVLSEAWEHSWSGGLGSLEDWQKDDFEKKFGISLSTYAFPQPISEGGSYYLYGTQFTPIRTEHIADENTPMDTFGLIITHGDIKILWTSDSKANTPSLLAAYPQVDLIIHDCETMGYVDKEKKFSSGVHPHYYDLVWSMLPEDKKKTILCHYQDGSLPDCQADGFYGWAYAGQSILTCGKAISVSNKQAEQYRLEQELQNAIDARAAFAKDEVKQYLPFKA